MIGMGFVKNWEQMAGLRVLLGFLEAGGFAWPLFNQPPLKRE
jgi:hypothetical protein